MINAESERLRAIKTLPSLVKFLRDELDWPIEVDEVDILTFDYTSEELGLNEKHAAKIKEIKQLRPLDSKQPWGIFWVSFEKKRLPMVVLRRILGNLIIKTRAGARKADHPSWHLHDLLFISSYGEEEHRNISFAHFAEDPATDELPVLRVLGWDDQNSVMHLDRVANQLHTHLYWPADPDDVEAWRQRWSAAFTDRYLEAIRSADELIPRLAHLAANIRRRVRDVLDAETERGPMRRLFAAVQRLLIHDMNEDGFADMYAQTIAYGLLSARFSHPIGLTAQNLVQLTAVSNPFLENLLESLFHLNRGKYHFDIDEVGINDVLDLLRNTNMEAIKVAFSDKNPAEDPVIRFYEGFLKQYDPQQRVKRGVFFTPRPVVSYIVRSVHELLKTEFGLEDGLASIDTWADMKKRFSDLTIPEGAKPDDPFVCILDPATGTGTFLFECIEVIERTMKEKWRRELGKNSWNNAEIIRQWREYVPRHLLPRLFGYELMMAPYSIAHLKLALKLGETGYQFQEGDRLHIYLTNSLELPTKLADSLMADMFSTLASEAQEVNEIKSSKRFTIVIGNPPYAGHSWNLAPRLRQLTEPYHLVGSERIKEKGALQLEKSIQDDYVKFFRYGQVHIDRCGVGILGLVTSNGFLDNPFLRGMRFSMLTSFTNLSMLDLHGNVLRQAKSPDGSPDKNVFDIKRTGIAISIFRKLVDQYTASTKYAEKWGDRDTIKYPWLMNHTAITTSFNPVVPQPSHYLFIPQDLSSLKEYERGYSIAEIMPIYSKGVVTGRDAFVIDFDEKPLLDRMAHFAGSDESDDELVERFDLNPSDWWHVDKARSTMPSKIDLHKYLRQLLYRPFDLRVCFYHPAVFMSPRRPVMKHMEPQLQNILLITSRMTKGESFQHVTASKGLAEAILLSSKTSNNAIVFPLYLYPENEEGRPELGLITERRPNFTPRFLEAIHHQYGLPVTNGLGNNETSLGVEALLDYFFAILHSPDYRKRYAAQLSRDFPRLPLASNLELFRALSLLGGKLVALHLMELPRLSTLITKWQGSTPSNEVEKVTYSDETVWIDKAQTEGFRGVPENVWNFHIGGYQVCEKWLKDRCKANRQLSADDITHYQKIVVALNETMRLMREIDEVIEQHGGWPGAFSQGHDDSSEGSPKKEEAQVEIVLVKEKETPGTWRFKEDKEDHPMTIYLTKEQVKELGNPESIKVTISAA